MLSVCRLLTGNKSRATCAKYQSRQPASKFPAMPALMASSADTLYTAHVDLSRKSHKINKPLMIHLRTRSPSAIEMAVERKSTVYWL